MNDDSEGYDQSTYRAWLRENPARLLSEYRALNAQLARLRRYGEMHVGTDEVVDADARASARLIKRALTVVWGAIVAAERAQDGVH